MCLCNTAIAQDNKGIHFQGIARSENGMIIAKKQITLRISIVSDTIEPYIEYQEIKSVTTNVLGLFYTNIGTEEAGKIITIGSLDSIRWQVTEKYLLVEVDPNNNLHFLQAGYEKINYVPYSFYATQAKTITSILPIVLGGTGVNNKVDLLKGLNLEKVNNTADSLKPLSIAMNMALNEKFKKIDTITLSNRINLKLNYTDTLKLSNRINLKLNAADTLNLLNRIQLKLNSRDTIFLSERINQLNDVLPQKNYGVFYDTAKQITLSSTATAIKFNFQQINNNINIVNNTANSPTRISVLAAGVYQVNYYLQFIKLDAGSDELIVWIRKNSAALANSNNTYSIQGLGVKNNVAKNFLIELAENDYIEVFFSVKNANTVLQGTISSTLTPSRPATPSATVSLHSVH
jgi:hypothetical protein